MNACKFCGYRTDELHEIVIHTDNVRGKVCTVCYGAFWANAFKRLDSNPQSVVLRHISFCTNTILDALKHK
jgi:hypothetical protein